MNRERLIEAGVDYDGGVKRFGGSRALYEKFIIRFFDEGLIAEIDDSFKKKDFDTASRRVHALKGESGNLSLTRLYEKACTLMDMLRNNSNPDEERAVEMLEEIKLLYNMAEQAARGE